MALFELSIYGDDDAILKTYATDKVRWGVFMQAVELQDRFDDEDLPAAEQFKIINQFMKKIFPSMTDEELRLADGGDVINTFTQLLRKANNIIGGNSKNARRAAEN